MKIIRTELLPVTAESHIVAVRQMVRRLAVENKFSLVDQTKIVTAASELARNLLVYGGGGEVLLTLVEDGARQGLQIEFIDRGPGILDINLALRDGYTSGSGMGLGLGGAKRLVNEFDIVSKVGEGTKVTIRRWR